MPGYKGRLIWPQIAVIYQLDTVATAADPDGLVRSPPGTTTSGMCCRTTRPVCEPPRARKTTPIRLPVRIEPSRF